MGSVLLPLMASGLRCKTTDTDIDRFRFRVGKAENADSSSVHTGRYGWQSGSLLGAEHDELYLVCLADAGSYYTASAGNVG